MKTVYCYCCGKDLFAEQIVSSRSLRNCVINIFYQIYKLLIKPLLGNGHCRFYPSCSDYAKDCFMTFSFPRALWYSSLRIFKCHPLNSGGYDPIPGKSLPSLDDDLRL